jgi:uncharacterized protein (DUF433 family)
MRPSTINRKKACIAGTRVAVADTYAWHERMGMTPDQIVSEYPFLSHLECRRTVSARFG